jgi:hypothetical protein
MSWLSDLGDWVGDQWDGMWTGLDNFVKWADETDWFPSSGGYSTGINLYNYNEPQKFYDDGYTTGSLSYEQLYLGAEYKITRKSGVIPSDPVVGSLKNPSYTYAPYYSDLTATMSSTGLNLGSMSLDIRGTIIGSAANGGGDFTSSNMFKRGMQWVDAVYRMNNNMPADAYSLSGNIDIVPFAGYDMSPVGKLWVTNGKHKGESKWIGDAGIAIGVDIGASAVLTSYYYVGNINNMKLNHFKGNRWSISGGLSYYVEAGGGYMIAPLSNGDYIIGKMVHLGISPPGVSGNINWGETNFFD